MDAVKHAIQDLGGSATVDSIINWMTQRKISQEVEKIIRYK